jgi:beta-lactamase family protein
MVVRHGHVVAEGWWAPYSAERPHLLYSLTKSFTSVAVGLTIADGLLSLGDRVVDVLPDHGTTVLVDPVDGGWLVRFGSSLNVEVGYGEWRESSPLGRSAARPLGRSAARSSRVAPGRATLSSPTSTSSPPGIGSGWWSTPVRGQRWRRGAPCR